MTPKSWSTSDRLKTNENEYFLFWAGIGPRLFKVAPACAIMISTYEYGKSFFSHLNEKSNQHPWFFFIQLWEVKTYGETCAKSESVKASFCHYIWYLNATLFTSPPLPLRLGKIHDLETVIENAVTSFALERRKKRCCDSSSLMVKRGKKHSSSLWTGLTTATVNFQSD